MAKMAGAGQEQSQESGASSGSPVWVVRAQGLGPASATVPGHEQGAGWEKE